MGIKVDIFSGFLGAGKTTLIKKLLTEGIYSRKTVIIENEFGQVSVDGSFLKEAQVQVKEISAGCICCSLSGDFYNAINEVIKTYSPDRIIIEPSGVGKLSDVIAVVKDKELKDKLNLNMIITVVDAVKYEMYAANFGEFYKNQISNCKTVVISRTQKLPKDKLVKITEDIKKINQKANIVTTPWEYIKAVDIVEAAETRIESTLLEKVNIINKPLKATALRRGSNRSAGEVFDSWGIETPRTFTKEFIESTLIKLGKGNYGEIIRAKGVVQTGETRWNQFDYVPGEYEIRDSKADYTGRICVIGTALNKEALKTLFSLS